MSIRSHLAPLVLLVWLGPGLPMTAPALILTGRGNEPVRDAGWPQGALALANQKTRVGWWEGPPFGGGQWQFLYRGDSRQFMDALTALAAIPAPRLELVIHAGPEHCEFLKDSRNTNADTRVDWTFTVWNPGSWHRLYNNPRSVFSAESPDFRQAVAPPRLDLYLGGGQVDWAQVRLPKGVMVTDERAETAGFPPAAGTVVQTEIFDMATGKPIAGAHVTGANMSRGGQSPQDYQTVAEAVCDTTGHVVVEKIPPGTHRVTVTAEGYAPRVLGYHKFGQRSLKHFETQLANAAEVRGRFTDTAEKPLPGVTVRADHLLGIDGRGYTVATTTQTVTDQEGRFSLNGLPTGYTQLFAHATGYCFGDVFTIHEVPVTNVVLRMSRAGAIHIKVTDSRGQPMARFEGDELHVSVEPKGGSRVGAWGAGAKVNDDATVDLRDVPPGEYRITSRPNPGTTNRRYAAEQIVKVEPGGTVSVNIVYE